MTDRAFIGWYTATRNGADIPQWRSALASCGVEVAKPDAPVYQDQVPRKPRNGQVTFDSLPELNTAIRAMRPLRAVGLLPVLVVPNFAHFVSPDIWRAAWERIVNLGGIVLCAETRKDVSDIETGLTLMRSRRGRTVAEKAKKARLKFGRPTRQLNPGKRAEVIRLFGDRDWTIGALADLAGVSVMTLRRRLDEWTGTREKAVAVMLADDGKWPPKGRLVDSPKFVPTTLYVMDRGGGLAKFGITSNIKNRQKQLKAEFVVKMWKRADCAQIEAVLIRRMSNNTFLPGDRETVDCSTAELVSVIEAIIKNVDAGKPPSKWTEGVQFPVPLHLYAPPSLGATAEPVDDIGESDE